MSYSRPHLVYFMKPIDMDGPIKIGCSSVPQKRLEALSAWSPFPLEVLATARGSYSTEHALHQRFAHLHLHREWFLPGDELVDAIQKIANGTPIDCAVDLSVKMGSIRQRGKGSRPEPEYRKGYRSYSCRVMWAEKKLRKLDEDAAWQAPDDVRAIIDRWNGSPYRNIAGERPSSSEFFRLEEYLADPAAHSVIPHWRRQRDAA